MTLFYKDGNILHFIKDMDGKPPYLPYFKKQMDGIFSKYTDVKLGCTAMDFSGKYVCVKNGYLTSDHNIGNVYTRMFVELPKDEVEAILFELSFRDDIKIERIDTENKDR